MKKLLRAGLVLSLVLLASAGRASAHVVMQPLNVSVGGGPLHTVEIDTGSVGIVVPRSILGPGARSTGRAGQVEYTSSGRIFTGTYFDAPIAISDYRGHLVRTRSIEVLAIDAGSCAPHYVTCHAAEGVRGVGMMGVGFARDTGSPAVNPFLHLVGSDESPLSAAYLIRRDSVVLGADARDERDYTMITLHANPGTADWAALPGCFATDTSRPFCGSVLVDTGLSEMLLRVPPAQRAPSISITSGTAIEVWLPTYSGRSPAAVSFTAVVRSTSAPIAPPSARWSDAAGPYFLNTGRGLLAVYDYLYDADRGIVGFFRRP